MARWQYTKGLHALGNGSYAYLQPDGGWGLSNAGLVVDDGETLLVDTLMDLTLTREMLAAMRRSEPAAAAIGTLVNTHSNPDHTNGNQLVAGARIISSAACLDEMREQAGRAGPRFTGDAQAFFEEVMGPDQFDFSGIIPTLPTRSFEDELSLRVGRKEVRLAYLGPAHTRGDLVAYVPEDRTLFTGDILFIDGHPVVWAGPVDNWIRACDTLLGWDIETVVPGHGPITDKNGIRAVKHYLEYVRDEARKRFDAGIPFEEAARDIALDAFSRWIDRERIVVNVYACYRDFGDRRPAQSMNDLFAAMGRYRRAEAEFGDC